MDTPQADPVLAQLRKLREGPGLTLDRLSRAGAVLSALGTSDPLEGRDRLLGLLASLPRSDRVRALRSDLNIELDEALGRQPADRERERLGERRTSYADVVKRDVKTLARWSDRAAAELRALMLNDSFNGDLYVVANVRGARILGTSLIQQPLGATKDGIAERESLDIANPVSEPSMPCLIYAFPRDWQPATMTLTVVFHGEGRPVSTWATYSDNMLKLPFGAERWLLKIGDDGVASCTFKAPRRELVYGLWW